MAGAAGGIGMAVARSLAGRYRLCLVDRDAAGLSELATTIEAAEKEVVDVTSAASCEQLVENVLASQGEIELLVLTAGLSAFGDVPTGDVARWQSVIEVNTLSVMYLIRAFLPGMLARRQGHIVVIASASGRITYVGEPAYVASKHATVAFCDCLRKELVGSGVKLTVVEPGLVDTPMAQTNPFFRGALETVTKLRPRDIAATVDFAITQPPNVCINEIMVRPTDQAL